MLYTALDRNQGPIITIIASNEEEAREKVRAQLGRDHRRQWYLREWQAAGELVIPRRRLEEGL